MKERNMRTFAKVSLAILLMAVLAWASDPWKSKPYQDWDQKDVSKVLNDSPWVKTITVTASWSQGNMSMGVPNNSQQQGGVAMGHPNMGGAEPNMTGGLPGGNSPGQGMRRRPETSFEARWVSAKTMRKALARMEVLNGKIQQPEAERYVAEVPPDYAIIVFGRDMTPFSKLDEASIIKHSSLEMKKSKQKIAPTSVKLQRKDGRLMAIIFHFPKTASGKPTIVPNEKSIELVCKLQQATLKFHFDPRKMKNKQGRDL
jgi:hypothetical protein